MRLFSNLKIGEERFPALTGVRALAAFIVFFHHLRLHLTPGWLEGLERTFYWGVTLFFVLSGFLITYRYYDAIVLSGAWLRTYFVNRFARIYPVYFLVLTAVILLSRNFYPIFLLQNYTLTHSLFFLFKSQGMAIDPSWSLTVEECFYLLAPFTFVLCKKYNLWIPFLLHILLLAVILLTYGHNLPSHMDSAARAGNTTLRQTIFPILFGTYFGHCFEFFAGIYLALLVLKKQKNRPTPGVPGAPPIKCTLAGIVGIAILMAPLIYATNTDIKTREWLMILVNNFMLPFPVVLFYYGLIFENSFCKRILSGRWMGLLGRSSYAFYLLHLPVIDWLGNPYLRNYFGDDRYNLYVMTIFLITLLLSVLLFVFFEDPANRFIRKKTLIIR